MLNKPANTNKGNGLTKRADTRFAQLYADTPKNRI